MKNWMLAILSVALLVACQPKEYQITGTLEGATGENVVLKNIRKGRPEVMDSAKLVDGAFTFKGSVEAPELALLFIDGQQQPVVFFIDNANITINAKVDDIQNAEITGSELTDKLKTFNEEMPGVERMKELQQEYYKAQMAKDKETMQVLGEEANSIMEEQKAYFENFVDNNTTNAMGAYMAMNMARSLSLEELKELIAKFEASLSDHVYVAEMNELVADMEKMEARLAATKEGAVAPDFTLTSKDGKEVSLSSFRGKYVLVDFWASWCGPCRGENPNVVKAYKKYNSKGFEVLSVSVDNNQEKWLEAIEADGLTWTQVRDTDKEVGKLYAIQNIPTTLLLDKEGVIIAKNLRGEELENKLAELLN